MPFEPVKTIRPVGPVTEDEMFLIATDSGNFFASAEVSLDGSWKFFLHQSRWPQRVRTTAQTYLDEIQVDPNCRPARMEDVRAWLDPGIHVGQFGLLVTLRHVRSGRIAPVLFPGQIRRMVQFPEGKPAI